MRAFLIVSLFLTTASHVMGQTEDVRKKNFNVKKNIAIEGYDPIGYFDNNPREGKSTFQFTYKGIVYQFADQANLNRFKATPEKYEPAYGGWCAYAMGETGEKVKIDPETYKILDGKLYLFYNFWGNNTLSDWNKNEKVLRSKGDQAWKKFVQ